MRIKMQTRILYLAAIAAGLMVISSCADNNETPPPFKEFIPGEIVTIDQVKVMYADEMAKPWQERIPVQILSLIHI